MLRRNIRSSVFVLLALAACTNKNNVKITGEIKEAENQKVYLEQLNVDQAVIIDSTKTDRNGHFTFKTTMVVLMSLLMKMQELLVMAL